MVIQKDLVGAMAEATLEGHLLDVIYFREAVNIEMVMDVSATMNDPAPSSPAGDPKLALMKQAACMITDFLHDHGQANDRMGLVWFTDDASEYTNVAGDKLFQVQPNTAALKGQVNAHGTGNCTAMGAGLQTAFNTLMTQPNHRFAILCTDGMQNIDPKVTEVAGHYEIVDSGGWLCGSHAALPGCPGDDIAWYNAAVHTIGIGITAAYSPVLQDVATQTGGFYLGTDDPASDLDLIYFVDLCNCLAGGSPAVVCHEAGCLNAEEKFAYEYFCLNATARKLTVLLSWPQTQHAHLTFWLYGPDGQRVNLDTFEQFDTYALGTVYLPRRVGGQEVPHVGQWRAAITGHVSGACSDYHLMAVAEDQEIHFHVAYPPKFYTVGDILPIHVDLSEWGKPIVKVSELALEVAHLRLPLAELMSEYRTSDLEIRRRLGKSAGHRQDPVILKLKAMAADPTFAPRLRPMRQVQSLRKGTLRPEFGEQAITLHWALDQAGLHTFKVLVEAETPENGPVQRVSMVSVLVHPGAADPKHSVVTPMEAALGGRKGLRFRVTPKNSRGQLLGPGYGERIAVRAGEEYFSVKPDDLLDGSYELEMLLPPEQWALLKKRGIVPEIVFDRQPLRE